MELKQLKYFHSVNRLGSVTKAAEQLHVAQPAISIAIQKLEEEIGVKLFDRSKKQFVLTNEGQAFLRRIDDILNRLQDTISEMNDFRQLQKGTIRVGIPPMLGAFLFPYIFKEFRMAYPGLEINVIEEGTLSIQKKIKQGEIDIGVIMVNDLLPNLGLVPISTGEILVCLPIDHELGRLSKIPFEELRNEPFILLNENTYVRKLILNECVKHNLSPKIIFSSSQIHTMLGLVEQGTGITFMLDKIVDKYSNIISRSLVSPILIQAAVAWNKDSYISSASQAFIDFIKEFSLKT